MAEKMERWQVQIVVPEGSYEADQLMADLVNLVTGNTEIEIVSVELDPDQEMPNQC
jgi:hypothetical protein